MPYSGELRKKETGSVEIEREKHNFGMKCEIVASQTSVDSDLSSVSHNDVLFSFINDAHLLQAQEFMLKGYNKQIPEVDSNLIASLQQHLSTIKSRLCIQTSVSGQLGTRWLLDQISIIERLIARLTDDKIRDWIKHELQHKSGSATENTSLGSRRMAQSLVRGIESVLQTMIHIVHLLRISDDYGTPEKQHAMLISELAGALSFSDENILTAVINNMLAETTGNAAWYSLVQIKSAAWKTHKASVIAEVIDMTKHNAEKANKKARHLQGDSQAFFSHVAAYFQNLSGDLAAVPINATQSALPENLILTNNGKADMPSSRAKPLLQRIDENCEKKKELGQVVLAVAKRYAYRSAGIIRQGHFTKTASEGSKSVIIDSITRSILWLWQQPAVKIQFVSTSLLSKVEELKNVEGIIFSFSSSRGDNEEQRGIGTSVSHISVDDIDHRVRQWVQNNNEYNDEIQLTTKVATLERLLEDDIVNARELLAHLGKNEESIQNLLRKQRFAVLKMVVGRLPAIAPALNVLEKLLPDIARNLAISINALDKALLLTDRSQRNFSEAKKHAGSAQLVSTKVKEILSAESMRLTERSLDEYSRGSRLAKHWANLAKENNLKDCSQFDATKILPYLKEKGFLTGILSSGDPEGYLFVTRLTTELENARNDELKLPMSPEQYAAIEKNLVEYIVKWGQSRVTTGITRLIVTLSFEHALDTVSFSTSTLLQIPYKVLKASIKIPYKVTRINNYIMPGHDKPYKAIYGLVQKKLKQLGFNLLMAPVPGMLKLSTGGVIMAGAALHNLQIRSEEKAFSAVYQRVVEGKKNEKIKINSLKSMISDSVIDGAFRASSRGIHSSILSEITRDANNYDNAYKEEQVRFISEVTYRPAQHGETVNQNDNYVIGNALENKSEAVIHSSLLQASQDIEPCDVRCERASGESVNRRKRAVLETDASQYDQQADFLSADEYLKSDIFSINSNSGMNYQDLTAEQKQQSYFYALNYILLKIENDDNLPASIRNKAYLARSGAKVLVPADIARCKLNNTVFLPDSYGSRTGILICLDSAVPYYSISEGKDFKEDILLSMPYGADRKQQRLIGESFRKYTIMFLPGGIETLNDLRRGNATLKHNFNDSYPKPMDTKSLSEMLANNIEKDYQLKGQSITNNLIVTRAIAGAHIPHTEVSASDAEELTELINGFSDPAFFLKVLARPFTYFSGEIQLTISLVKGETLLETVKHVHEAEYIGSWIDVTIGTVALFTPEGLVLNIVQSTASIGADLLEGKNPDPLAVAGLVLSVIPEARIAAKVGKLTHLGGGAVKYGLMFSNKVVDLGIVAEGIKTAVESGDPLAIYQALLSSGMSVKHSYSMAKDISSKLKIKNNLEDRASQTDLEALNNNASGYSISSTMPALKFNVGSTEMLGKINNGKVLISGDNGITWSKGNDLHLLAYRLQNAGGKLRLPGMSSNKIHIGEYTFKPVKFSQANYKKFTDIESTYIMTSNSSAKMANARKNYKLGSDNSHLAQYNHFNKLSLDEKISLYIKEDTDVPTRGVLAVKIKESIAENQRFNVAKLAEYWKASANKATDVILAPQDIFLKGKSGECLPESVLMGLALHKGVAAEFAKKLMGIYSSAESNSLYKSLLALHADGNSSQFSTSVLSDIELKNISEIESKLFPAENSSVRVDIPKHTMLISKTQMNGKVKYVFYDPNYGLAYFDNYKDMIAFFVKKLADYEIPENAISFRHLDYSRLADVEIKGRNLVEIIDGEIPEFYQKKNVNLTGVVPDEGIYRVVDRGRQANKYFIKVNDCIYQVEWNKDKNTWQVIDSVESSRVRAAVPVKRDADGEWFKISDSINEPPVKQVKLDELKPARLSVPKPGNAKNSFEIITPVRQNAPPSSSADSDKTSPAHPKKTFNKKITDSISSRTTIEPLLHTPPYKTLSSQENNLIDNTSKLLKTKLGQQYDAYVGNPRANCANAAIEVTQVLRANNYTDVRIMELGIWPNGGAETTPANHYVVTAKKDGIEICVDLTAGQFERYGFTGPVIDTKDNWINVWQRNMRDKPRTLVKLALISGGISTSPFNLNYLNPQLTVPNGVLLQRPDWYKI